MMVLNSITIHAINKSFLRHHTPLAPITTPRNDTLKTEGYSCQILLSHPYHITPYPRRAKPSLHYPIQLYGQSQKLRCLRAEILQYQASANPRESVFSAPPSLDICSASKTSLVGAGHRYATEHEDNGHQGIFVEYDKYSPVPGKTHSVASYCR